MTSPVAAAPAQARATPGPSSRGDAPHAPAPLLGLLPSRGLVLGPFA